MAIKRIPRIYKSFEYEGEKYAMRPPTTGEVMEVTRQITNFQRSLKKDISADVKDNIAEYGASAGDMTIMIEVQKYVAKTFCVDFDSHEPVFGTDSTQENIETIPAEFVAAAFACYSSSDKFITAMAITNKLGAEFEPIVRALAIVDRKSFVAALKSDGKYTDSQIEDYMNNIDGKIVIVNKMEGEDEINQDPTTTAATTI